MCPWRVRNVIKIVTFGSLICVIINCEQLAFILLDTIFRENNADDIYEKSFLKAKIIFGINVFNAVKVTLVKGIFSIAVVKMFLMTRNGLRQSAKMSNNKNKQSVHYRLFVISLIPLFLSILFTATEVLDVIKPILKDKYGCEHHWVIRDDVTLGLSASLFTFGSFVYFGGYLILFPQIRQTVTECCNGLGA